MLDYRLIAELLIKQFGGKSGQQRVWQLLTATKSNLRESATETKPPRLTG